MASSSPRTDPSTYFGFKDLQGFKDFVVYVLACAPNLFPEDEWRGPEEQMNLDRAFLGLRYGLTVARDEKRAAKIIDQCQQLVDDSYLAYQKADEIVGQEKLEEVERLLKQLPSR